MPMNFWDLPSFRCKFQIVVECRVEGPAFCPKKASKKQALESYVAIHNRQRWWPCGKIQKV
jgi:hypothetical protein